MLSIRDLRVTIGAYEIVHIEKLDVAQGRRVGLVGESGSGKSLTAMSIAGLQPREARLTGSIRFGDRELIGLTDDNLAAIRGRDIGFIPQDPTRALNPTTRIGKQVAEALRLNTDLEGRAVKARVLDLLRQVQLPDVEAMVRRYPHQISGGQQQRILIAMAIAANPRLLIADEPTTALDVTVQNEILRLIVSLSATHNMSLLFVSHELGVVRAVCDEIGVVYGGQLVEMASSSEIVSRPRHRYTDALIGANPGLPEGNELTEMMGRRFHVIEGSVPSVANFPDGCRFRDRCGFAIDRCTEDPPVTGSDDHLLKCWNPVERTPGA